MSFPGTSLVGGFSDAVAHARTGFPISRTSSVFDDCQISSGDQAPGQPRAGVPPFDEAIQRIAQPHRDQHQAPFLFRAHGKNTTGRRPGDHPPASGRKRGSKFGSTLRLVP